MSARYGAVLAIFWQLPWIFHDCIKQEMTFEGFGICLMYVFIHVLFQPPFYKGQEMNTTILVRKRVLTVVLGLFVLFYLQSTELIQFMF